MYGVGMRPSDSPPMRMHLLRLGADGGDDSNATRLAWY